MMKTKYISIYLLLLILIYTYPLIANPTLQQGAPNNILFINNTMTDKNFIYLNSIISDIPSQILTDNHYISKFNSKIYPVNLINQYAMNSNADELTIDLLNNGGIKNIKKEFLLAYQSIIAKQTSINSLADIQFLIDGVNCVESATKNILITTEEDTNYIFSKDVFDYTEMPGHTFAGIKVMNNISSGQLQYCGIKVISNSDCPDMEKLIFHPFPNENGTPYSSFRYKIKDSSGIESFQTATITVNVTTIDDPPIVKNPIPEIRYYEDDITQPIDLAQVFTDIDNIDNQMVFSLKDNSMPSLLGLTIQQSTAMISLQPDAHGIASITVQAESNHKTVCETFLVIVDPKNDPPVIDYIPDVSIVENSINNTLNVTIMDKDTALSDLRLFVQSSNPELLPEGNVDFSGTGTYRKLFITPKANMYGKGTLSITVNDQELSSTTTVDILVDSAYPITIQSPFDGIQIPDAPPLQITDEFTLEVRIFPMGAASLPGCIFSKISENEHGFRVLLNTDRTITAVIGNDLAINTLTSLHALDMQQWSHIAITADTKLLSIYINSKLDQQIDIVGSCNFHTETPAAIGADIQSMHLKATYSSVIDPPYDQMDDDKIDTRECMPFKIDAVRLWPVKKTSVEIMARMFNRNLNSNPSGYWYAKDNQLTDYSGNNNPGFFFKDVPEISSINEQTILEDNTLSVDFTVDQRDGYAGDIQTLISASDQNLIPNMTISGDLIHRTINLFPGEHQNGSTLAKLIADNGSIKRYAFFNVIIEPVNDPPTAHSGLDFSVNEETLVVLDATKSKDIETGQLAYNWTQISGQPVDITNFDTVNPSFTAPSVSKVGGSVSFELQVTDAGELTDTDSIIIYVTDVPKEFTITANAQKGGQISPQDQTVVMEADTKNFSIIPDEGYDIESVWVDGQSQGNIHYYTFLDVSDNHTITAEFRKIQHSVFISDTINGRIVPEQTQIINEGDDLELQFLANTNYEVQSILINGESVGRLTNYTIRSIAKNYTVSASFIEQPVIVATAGKNGTITPSGTFRTAVGASQTFKITPDPGYKINTVLMDEVEVSSPPYVFFALTEQHTISARFNKYQLNINLGPNGHVEPDIKDLDAGVDYTLMIIPDEGFEIDTLTENGKTIEAVSPYYLFDVSTDYLLDITFKSLPIYTVKVASSDGGIITPNGTLTVMHGKSLAFDLIPNERYYISNLIVDDQTLPAQSTYLLKNIENNHDVFANFSAETWYAITSTAGDGGQIDPQGIIEKKENDIHIYQIIPDEHYQVENVYVDNVAIDPVRSIAIKADANHHVHATFESTIRRTIQGHVLAENTNNPLKNYRVELWDDETFINFANTDSQGAYTFTDLKQSEQYIISAYPPTENDYYVGQYYPQAESWDFANRLSVIDNDLSDIDFYLKQSDQAGLSGQVRTSENIPIAYVSLDIYLSDQTYVKQVTTDQMGYYTITGLSPENSYMVSYYHENSSKDYYYVDLSDNPIALTPTVPVLQNIDIVVKPGQIISGFVQDYAGKSISGINVNAWSDYLNEGNAATTDENGQYTIFGLTPVISEEASEKGYIVEIQATRYPYQVYPYAEEKELGQKIATNVNHIDFKLRKGNDIYGAIINNYNEPMANVTVIAWSKKAFGNIQYKTLSSANGAYSLTDLPVSDDYIVGAFSEIASQQYYQFKENSENATLVNIVGSNQSDITFTMNIGSRISGNVSIESTTEAGIKVELSSSSLQFHTNVQTNASGYFEIIGLNETVTDYLLVIRHPGYFPIILENLQPSETTININLNKSIHLAGKIFGDQELIDQASIHAQSIDQNTEVYTISENGDYTLTGLNKGQWRLTVHADRFFDQEKTFLLEDHLSDVDFHLEPIPLRSISGTVIGLISDENLKIQACSTLMNVVKTITLEGNGLPAHFSISSLLASSDYTLELISNHFPGMYFDKAQSIGDATVIDISENSLSELIIRVHQDTLSDISGVITFPENTEHGQGITLHAILDGQKKNSINVVYKGLNQENYIIQGLSKRKNFVLYADSSVFMQKYYDGTELGTDYFDNSSFIDLTNTPAENVNIHLTMGGQIYGVVTDMNDNPMSGIRVEAWSDDIQNGQESLTDDSGQYRIMGLKGASDYKIRLFNEIRPILYYSSFGTVADRNLADNIDLQHGAIMIDITMKEGESIYGTVRNTNHLPLENIWISAWSEIMKTGNAVFTDSEGKFVLNGLPVGNDYKIIAETDSSQEYMPETFQNISTGGAVDFVLKSKLGYILSGEILNHNNAPVANVKVEIESASDHTIYAWTTTDNLGKFVLPILPEKLDYFLQVWPHNQTDAYNIDYPIELVKNIEKTIYLEPGLTISGYVRGREDQQPIKDITIRIASTSLHLDLEVKTDKNGYYEWKNAKHASDYIITAAGNSDIYPPLQVVDRMPSKGINFELESSGSITGQIRDSNSKSGISGAIIEIYSHSHEGMKNFSGVVYSDSQGVYQVNNLKRHDEQGALVNDYIVLVHAEGYQDQTRNANKVGDNVNIDMKRGSTISGSILNINRSNIYVVIYYEGGRHVTHTLAIKYSGNFSISGLYFKRRYQLFITGYLWGYGYIRKWAGQNGEAVSSRNQAGSYAPGSYIIFNPGGTSRNAEIETNTDRIEKIYSSSQSFRFVRQKHNPDDVDDVDDVDVVKTLNVPPISSKSKISVDWEGVSGQRYYTSFSKESNFEFDITNIPKTPPIRTSKITSRDLEGDDIYYYFHVATVDKDGRIGDTTSIAFRIDTTPPQNVSVIPPIDTPTRNIHLQLGASGATEVYISNLNYQEGGKWINFSQNKKWELDRGYGDKTIFVRFRDRAGNQTRMSGETFFQEASPIFTVSCITGDNGEVLPSGTIEAPQHSNLCFTIQPDQGYHINRFIVDQQTTSVTDNEYCLTDIQAVHNLQVTFSLEQYIIQSSSDSNGQIYPSGQISVNKNASQTFVMTPKNGFIIDTLAVDFHNQPVYENAFTLDNIQTDHDIFVTFKRVFNISATSSGKGKIEPSGIVTVVSKKSASFNVLPDNGYTIDSLMVDGNVVDTDTIYTFINVNNNHSIHATFQRQIYSIEAIKGTGGRIEPEGIVNVESGETQQFTIIPDQGYTISHLIIDGKTIVQSVKRSKTSMVIHDYSFDNVSDDHTIVVSFMPIMRLITASSGPNGSIAPTGDVLINDGSSITFTAFPSDGYMLDTLQLDNVFQTVVDNQLTLDNVRTNHHIHATFKRMFRITSISGANGHMEPEGVIMADENAALTFTIIPENNHELDKLIADGIEMEVHDNRFALKDIQKDQTIIASFQLKQFKIISQAANHGTISPAGESMVDAGATKTFVIQPDVGCQMKELLINDQAVLLSGNQYTLENIDKDYHIYADFIVINNAPVVIDQTISMLEDRAISMTLTAFDLDNDTLTYHIQSSPGFGTYTFINTGIFAYTPNNNYFGSDTLTYIVNDGNIDSSAATIFINITPVNDIPHSYDDAIQLNEDAFTDGLLIAFDAENDPLCYTIVTQASKGIAKITNHKTGAFVYTPNPDMNGDDSFTFSASDNASSSKESVIEIYIVPMNDLPHTTDQIMETKESEAISITLLATDKDQDVLNYYLHTLPLHGDIIYMEYTIDHAPTKLFSPHIMYIPELDYRGLDNFSFYVNDGHVDSNLSEIQIQIGGSDISITEDTPIDLTDILPERITITSQPLHGKITIGALIMYQPETNYVGFDSFTYVVDDKEIVYSIYISPVNDPPYITNENQFDLLEDQPISLTILAEDIDGDDLSFQIDSPRHGSISVTLPLVVYYPNENFTGADCLNVRVSDKSETAQMTITLNVQPVNDAPAVSDIHAPEMDEDTLLKLTLIGQDIDSENLTYQMKTQAEHGTAEIINDQLHYTPDNNYFGKDQLSYQAFDGYTLSNEAVIHLTINNINDSPYVFPDKYSTNEDQSYVGKLTGSDVENNSLTFHIQTQPQHGQVNLNSQTGAFTFIPENNYFGEDRFAYYANDGKSDSNTAYITATILPVNDAPVVTDMDIHTDEDQRSKEFQLIANDGDSLTLIYQVEDLPKKGIVSLDSSTGTFTYMPEHNLNGVDIFTYSVIDGQLISNTASVFVQINAVNDAPVANDSRIVLSEESETQDYMLATDIDQDVLNFVIVTSPRKGNIELIDASSGQYRYKPYANEIGTDMVAFEVSDGYTHSNQARIWITIQPNNDPPIAWNASIQISEDTPFYGQLMAEDIDGDSLTYQIDKNGEKGTLTLSNLVNGEMVYIPKHNENGQDTILFSVYDGELQSNTATLTVMIYPVNDPPETVSQEYVISENEPFAITLTAKDAENEKLVYSLADLPQHGNITGKLPYITYTPEEKFFGIDTFTFVANDGTMDSALATIRLHVGIPDVPIITIEDTSISIASHLSMISTSDDFELTSPPAKGNLSGIAPNLTYTPKPNEYGNDSLTFFDKNTAKSYTLRIYIKPTNDTPMITQTEVLSLSEDQSIDISLSAIDIEQDPLIYQIKQQPSHGILKQQSNTTYTYTPSENYHGTDSFTFSVTDGFATDDSGQVDIIITPANDPPQAFDQQVDTIEETSVDIKLTGQDIDNDPLTYSIETLPQWGSIQIIDNTIKYVPNQNFAGMDQFKFTAIDSNDSVSLTATVHIHVQNTNDLPVAHDSMYSIKQGETLSSKLTFEEMDNDTLIFSIQQQPENGFLIFTNPCTGEFMYIPESDSKHHTDSFSYHIYDGHVYSNTANVLIRIEQEGDPSDKPIISLRLKKDYQAGDIYTVTLLSSETGQVAHQEKENSKELEISIDPGTYRLILFGKNYKPFEYPEPLVLSENPLTIDLDLESDDFDPFCPVLEISHIENSNGFDLRVIKKNMNAFQMRIQTDTGEVPITSPTRSLKSIRGTVDDPYHYVWTPDEPISNQTVQSMTDAVTENIIVFHFYDAQKLSQIIRSYTVVYHQFASDLDHETLKPETQKLFEKTPESGGVYGEKVLYKSSGEATFYPLMGTNFHLTVKDVNGEDKTIEINIPPIPLKYLVLDHIDAITYDQETDMLHSENSAISIQCNDLLKAVITYYTFGGDAIGTGIQLSFEMAEGKYKGSRVLYNPFIDGHRPENETAPFIGIPMLLNPASEDYEKIIESPDFWLFVEEEGDMQSGFRAERLVVDPEIDVTDGVVYIQMNHLTAVGLGVGEMPGDEAEESPGCVDCNNDSNCFLEMIMGW
jgi:hypothetical protein